jgi:hypothetical protein
MRYYFIPTRMGTVQGRQHCMVVRIWRNWNSHIGGVVNGEVILENGLAVP